MKEYFYVLNNGTVLSSNKRAESVIRDKELKISELSLPDGAVYFIYKGASMEMKVN